jgi:ribonucleoside-triphosphate reductase
MQELSAKILSDITIYSKYARYMPKNKRRETWNEIVKLRNMKMHIDKFPHLKDEIESAYKYVLDMEVLPSMRGLQFSGKPIELSPNRQYNCSALAIDDPSREGANV